MNYPFDGCTWCGTCDLCIDHSDCKCTGLPGDPTWSWHDVEEVAMATMHGLIPDLDVMARLGPNPPPEFHEALGRRVQELVIQAKGEEP